MRSIEKYYSMVKGDDWTRVMDTLQGLKDELVVEQKINKQVTRSAHAKAGMLIGGAFTAATGQLVGFTAAIYGIWDWNTVEPWTWTFSTFYLMVGSWYFWFTRSDFAYTSGYDYLFQRNLKSISKKQNVNLDKAAALEEHCDSLENKIS